MTDTDICESFGRFLIIRGYKSHSARDDEDLHSQLQSISGKVSKLIIAPQIDTCVVEYECREAAEESYHNGIPLLDVELSRPTKDGIEDFLPVMFQSSIIRVTGFPPSDTTDALFYFLENEKKSGGGDVLHLTVEKPGTANVTLASSQVAERLLKKRTMLFEGNTLSVCRPRMSFDRTARVCVTGINPNTVQHVIENFFSNPNQSGGGEITAMDYSDKEGKAIITFKASEAPERIMERREDLELENARLTVSWASKRRMHHSLPIYYIDSRQDSQNIVVNPTLSTQYAKGSCQDHAIPGHSLFAEKIPIAQEVDTVHFSDPSDVGLSGESCEDGAANRKESCNVITTSHKEGTGCDDEIRVFPGTVRVTLVSGSIETQEVHVIVNTTFPALSLNTGGVSAAIFNAAGSSIQNECDLNYPNGIEEGQFAITSGGRMSCKSIYHCACPKWNGINGTSVKVLRTLLKNILKEAQSEEATSIAFPAIGTGNLEFPPLKVAMLMSEEFQNFVKERPITVIQKILVVVCPAIEKDFQEFFQESGMVLRKPILRKHGDTVKPTSGKSPVEDSEITCDREPSVTVGSAKVKVTVKVGDITMENTDAIINSTNADFQFTGNVSRAIEKAAGNTVVEECKKLEIANKNSKFRNRFLNYLFNDTKPLYIGKITKGFAVTQAGNLPCHFIFHIDAPTDVTGWKKVIKGVLEEANNMDLQSISFPALGTGALQLNPDDIATIMIRTVMDFSKKRSPKLSQINICIFQEDMLGAFAESLMKETNKHRSSWITRIFPLLKRNQKQKTQKVMRRVQSQDIAKPIPPKVLPISSTDTFAAESGGRETYTETVGKEQTPSMSDGIILKSPADYSNNFPEGLPSHRMAMDYKEKFYKIPLQSGSEIYSDILKQLHDVCATTDFKIERIQNRKQYQLYEVLKSHMEDPNEQELWHGTSVDVLDQINANGFNRSCCGKNATLYGKGSYFAKHLSYANNYAEPDSNGFQYIYLCKVLAGAYTQGQENILEPPARHSLDKSIKYDSVVDDIENPTIYVIFKDGAAYPEYLITFKSA